MNINTSEAILILIAISVYDYLAVYVTGHMIRMLKSTILSGTIFAMIIPAKFSDLFKMVSEVGKKKSDIENETSESAYVYLGGGDLAFPLIMVVAALRMSLLSAIITAAGALAGLLVLNVIFTMQKERRPMAALPPLALFSILGFLVSLIKL